MLTFPELKTEEGPVAERLRAAEAGDDVMAAWKELVAQDIRAEEDAREFYKAFLGSERKQYAREDFSRLNDG